MTQKQDEWQQVLREYILFGLMFKAAMVDLATLTQVPLKLSYKELLEDLSRWAERRHYSLRRELRQHGCVPLQSEKRGNLYYVLALVNGYQREAVYSVELLQAECRQRVPLWLQRYEEERDGR